MFDDSKTKRRPKSFITDCAPLPTVMSAASPCRDEWDRLPVTFIASRTVDKVAKRIDASLEYPQYAFAYHG
ncbi:MAG: hypothetical protein ACLUHA_17695 [Bacteroides stercoris]